MNNQHFYDWDFQLEAGEENGDNQNVWSIKYMTLVAGWLLLPPICHLHQDYQNRILHGMRQRMRGSQLDGFLQAWTNFPPCIAPCMYDMID